MAKEVFKGDITLVSTDIADFIGLGITDVSPFWTGRRRIFDGKEYVLCQAGGVIDNGAIVIANPAVGTGVLSVIESTAGSQACIGANNTGVQIASGSYFWALARGPGYVLTGGALTDGNVLISGAAGTCTGAANAAAAVNHQGSVLDGGAGVDLTLNRINFNCTG